MIKNIEDVLGVSEKFKSSDEYVIYGTGQYAISVMHKLSSYNIKPVAFCDTHRVGEVFEGREIQDVKEVISGSNGNQKVIIATLRFYQEIKETLLQYISEENILPYYGVECLGFKEFVSERKEEFSELCDMLSDETSKEVLLKVLAGRTAVDFDYFEEVCEGDQYFAKDLVALSEDEVFVDCGAFTGDTLNEFIQHSENKFNKVFCFEPSDTTFLELQKTLDDHNGDERVQLIKGGLYRETTQLGFLEHNLSAGNSINENSENLIQVYAIDEVIEERISFIKMDIEGAELDALIGAKETILKYKPKLAISIYHKFEDYLEIPKYIKSLNLDYKFYVRHHTECHGDTILYAF